jgi:hypothetical protein
MHPVPVYSLSPRQIVDAMFTKHGQITGPDLQKLRDPLLKQSPALAELETHMNLFMLASIKLTASGHGENPYRYFEMFLESVKGFPLLLYRVPYGKPADYNGTFRVSPPSRHAHDGRIQLVSFFRGSNCSAQAYPESSPEAAKNTQRSQTLEDVDQPWAAGISTSFCWVFPASPNTTCFPWPGSRGGICGRVAAMLRGDGHHRTCRARFCCCKQYLEPKWLFGQRHHWFSSSPILLRMEQPP